MTTLLAQVDPDELQRDIAARRRRYARIEQRQAEMRGRAAEKARVRVDYTNPDIEPYWETMP